MSKKQIYLLFAVSITAAFASSFLFSATVSRANIFQDFLRQLLPNVPSLQSQQPAPAPAAPYRPTVDYEERVIRAVDQASPAVVAITISKDVPVIEQCPFDPFSNLPPELRQFFGDGAQFSQPCQKGTKRQQVGGGSGFIISSEGLIVTNKHVVIDTAADYTVFTNDGKKYPAKVLARDPVVDVALVKIDASGLPTLKLGDSASIKLGQTAIAIGNALGEFRNTVSVGVVSGLSRTITAGDQGDFNETIHGVIQTDAAINPGNSGGPLLNLNGEVIGIDTAVVSGAQNIGFAIPINQAKRAIESVKKNGKISSPYVGVRYMLITEDLAKKEKLPVSAGALIRGNDQGSAVVKDSPAAKAGLQAEDIITELNGQKIDADHDLSSLIQEHNVGDVVKLGVLRDGETLTVPVTLEERKNL